jgi:hypothetical protein
MKWKSRESSSFFDRQTKSLSMNGWLQDDFFTIISQHREETSDRKQNKMMKTQDHSTVFKNALMLLIGWMSILTCLAAGQDSDKVELKLQLPKPMFIGTPMNITSPNLETVSGKMRGSFYVPKGTVLLSSGKPVASSDPMPIIGEIEMITDGDKEGGDGYFVELGPSTQWIQVDLEAPAALHAILIWHYHSRAQVYRDVIVQVADDEEFLSGVKTVFNNDHDNTSGLGVGTDKEYIETSEGRLIDPKGIKGRYIRFYSRGNTTNDLNHYIEVEIYGVPIQ